MEQSGFCIQTGLQTELHDQTGDRLCSTMRRAIVCGLKLDQATHWIPPLGRCWLCSAVGQGQWPSSLVRWGPQLNPAVRYCWRLLCSLVGQGCYPGFLVRWCQGLYSTIRQGHKLYSVVGQGCKLGSEAGQFHRMGSEASWNHCFGFLVRLGRRVFSAAGHLCWLASLLRHAIECALQLPGIYGQTSWWGRTGAMLSSWTGLMTCCPVWVGP